MTETGNAAAFFRSRVLEWGETHRRDFPWRHTEDPFRVLIAEMMLRRTRAEQVTSVYEAFLRRFPDVAGLATAREADVSDVLRSLGLTWRVPAFRQVALQLLREHHGRVPRDRGALLALPGVGDYVADAVRCFAFGEPVALVDANTVRVAGRYLGLEVGPESRRRAPVRAAVACLVDLSSARASNLALLDFAALLCRARLPLHTQCPVAGRCAFLRGDSNNQPEVEHSCG